MRHNSPQTFPTGIIGLSFLQQKLLQTRFTEVILHSFIQICWFKWTWWPWSIMQDSQETETKTICLCLGRMEVNRRSALQSKKPWNRKKKTLNLFFVIYVMVWKPSDRHFPQKWNQLMHTFPSTYNEQPSDHFDWRKVSLWKQLCIINSTRKVLFLFVQK